MKAAHQFPEPCLLSGCEKIIGTKPLYDMADIALLGNRSRLPGSTVLSRSAPGRQMPILTRPQAAGGTPAPQAVHEACAAYQEIVMHPSSYVRLSTSHKSAINRVGLLRRSIVTAKKANAKKPATRKARAPKKNGRPARRIVIDTKTGLSAEAESVTLLRDVARLYLDHLA